MKAMYLVVALVLIVIAAGGGFYGGMAYASTQNQSTTNSFLQQRAVNGQNGGTAQQAAALGPCGFPQRTTANGGGQGGQTGQNGQTGPNGQTGQGGGQFFQRQSGNNTFAQFGNCVARGQIKSIDLQAGTMEISTPVNVVTVKLSDQTIVSETVVGKSSDLKTGDRVTVFSKDTGASPTASAVQLQGTQGVPGQ